jgi:hypothetical protein
MYKVLQLHGRKEEEVSNVLNPRRGPTQSAPGLPMSVGMTIADELFTEFGLEEYVGCVTSEMKERPIPHVFKVEETKRLTDLYKSWLPLITARILRELTPPVQPFNKKSRLGYFRFDNPHNKEIVLMDEFKKLAYQGLADYADAFTIVNVRLQAEARSKVREALFLSDTGVVELKQVDQTARKVDVKYIGPRTSSRVRLIFNLPMPNLYKQVYDTAAHNVLLKYPAFHHDMFIKGTLPVTDYHLCFDVKSFERYTADAVRARAEYLGGFYGEIGAMFSKIPFAVRSGKNAFFIWPDRAAGWADQYSSGDSAVAPVQKEILTAIYASFVCEEFHLNREAAIEFVWAGGNERFRIRNYGDDNSVSGDKGVIDRFLAYAQLFMKAEPEEPPKFLGFVWNRETEKWELPVSSYLLKTWLNERRPYSRFRQYPNLGWFQKREVYRKYGAPIIHTQVFKREDELLKKNNMPWDKVLERASAEDEASKALRRATPSVDQILDREYAMTAQQKLDSGEFFGLTEKQTAPILRHLLDKKLLALNTKLN